MKSHINLIWSSNDGWICKVRISFLIPVKIMQPKPRLRHTWWIRVSVVWCACVILTVWRIAQLLSKLPITTFIIFNSAFDHPHRLPVTHWTIWDWKRLNLLLSAMNFKLKRHSCCHVKLSRKNLICLSEVALQQIRLCTVWRYSEWHCFNFEWRAYEVEFVPFCTIDR